MPPKRRLATKSRLEHNDANRRGVSERREFAAPADAPRLDLLVAAQLDLSRNQAATLIANGRVSVGGRRERASYRATSGELVVVTLPDPPARGVTGEQIPLRIVFEDD